MYWRAAIAMLCGMVGTAAAQEKPGTLPGERVASLTAGVGNSLGWFGVQGERYLLNERLSLFVGLGYTPDMDEGYPTGPTFAAGFRTFTGGRKHRMFLEGSVSQLLIESDIGDGGKRYYGPGLQAGYQFVSRGGFTMMASLGAGYALSLPGGVQPWTGLLGLSLGYTWRGK